MAAPNPESLTTGLLVAGHHAARILEEHLAGTSLSAGEAVLLTALDAGPLTMSGVMSALHIKASTATSLVNRLQEAGLVVRSPNPDDKRSLLVGLTPDGREHVRKVLPAFQAVDELLTRAAGPRAVAGHRRLVAALASASDRPRSTGQH